MPTVLCMKCMQEEPYSSSVGDQFRSIEIFKWSLSLSTTYLLLSNNFVVYISYTKQLLMAGPSGCFTAQSLKLLP